MDGSNEAPAGGDGWISTFTGVSFYPLNPRVEDIRTDDIAHALAVMPRFTGHTREFYTVGEHSIRLYQELCFSQATHIEKLWGLVHDASEAYLMDIARPVKRSDEMAPYRIAEKRLEAVIAAYYGLPPVMPAIVKKYDEIMLATEARDLMNGFNCHWRHWNSPKLDEKIVPYSSNIKGVENKLLLYISHEHGIIQRDADTDQWEE